MEKVKVTLISCTNAPVQTICRAWEASRNNDPVAPIPPAEPTEAELKLFEQVIDSKIPVAEMVDFVFLLEGVSIALREQMVRHRIGVKVGDRIGMDIVPDLCDSSWWSQSMRILDMGQFETEERYDIPESILADPSALEVYRDTMESIQWAYNELASRGIPLEDARNIIPLAASHRLVWKLNLASLIHIVGKRGCWILQLGLWEPVIRGMVEALAEQIHPIFRRIIDPPCISHGKFNSCLFCLDNERRIQGEDEIPPCPLYLNHHSQEAVVASASVESPAWTVRSRGKDDDPDEGVNVVATTDNAEAFKRSLRMEEKYENLWGRDAWTAEVKK